MRRRSKNLSRAFTIVELLVVIGILSLTAALLLPTLSRSRESARRTSCLNNVRQLTAATLVYMNHHNGFLPEAASTNSPLESPMCPRATSKAPWTRPTAVATWRVLPSIGGQLQETIGTNVSVWQCPSAPAGSFVLIGADPYNGSRAPDEFKPNYNYMAGKEWFSVAVIGGPVAAQFKLREWAVRNISGLRMSHATPNGQPASQVVLFHDRVSTYHSKGHRDIYQTPGDWEYYASFGYLDGHAEGRTYRNVQGYIDALHKPIRQDWFGYDFKAVFPEQY